MRFLHSCNIKFIKVLCLLIVAGIFFICPSVKAQAVGSLDSNLTGTDRNETVLRQPGTAETPEELQELNIANGLTVTVNGDNGELSSTLRILITLTLIALAPTLIIMLTSFTRIIIVLHFTRNALNTQTAPSNQILIGLALFLTFFIMWPTFEKVNTQAIQPLDEGLITTEEAFERAEEPLREFMNKYTQRKDVDLFADIAGETYETYDEVTQQFQDLLDELGVNGRVA